MPARLTLTIINIIIQLLFKVIKQPGLLRLSHKRGNTNIITRGALLTPTTPNLAISKINYSYPGYTVYVKIIAGQIFR